MSTTRNRERLAVAMGSAASLAQHSSPPRADTLDAWAQQLDLLGEFTQQDLTGAVVAHYTETARKITLDALLRQVKAARRHRLQRQRAADRAALAAAEAAVSEYAAGRGRELRRQACDRIRECVEGCAPTGLVYGDDGILGRCCHDGTVDTSDPDALPVGWGNPLHRNYIPPENRVGHDRGVQSWR